jgi:putative membrane protein
MRIALIPITALALMVSGCTATDSAAILAPAAPATPTDRTGYVQTAAASDLFEIQSSQIAQTKAQRSEVRDFAQMMVTHHTQTTAALTAAASTSGITPQPTLMPPQAAMIQELQQASPASFDQLYMRQQVAAHQMALALHQTYAARGDTAALRTVAATAVPIVQQHLTRAQQLD